MTDDSNAIAIEHDYSAYGRKGGRKPTVQTRYNAAGGLEIRCGSCGEWKSEKLYYRADNMRLGRKTHCGKCMKEAKRERKLNPKPRKAPPSLRPPPDGLEIPGWRIIGVTVAEPSEVRYAMECEVCDCDARRLARTVDEQVAAGKPVTCKACTAKRPGKAGKFCGTCCDLPERRAHPVCRGCGKPPRETSPPAELPSPGCALGVY